MSFPKIHTKIELSDYILVEVKGGPETRYKIYKKDNYSEYPVDTLLAEILIPYYCREPKVKLGAFLPQFDKILCELLAVADREIVSHLFSETMKAVFPEEADNFELEIYEEYGGVYSTIDYSKEYFKRHFGHEPGESMAQVKMCNLFPPKRTMFQERDEIWENFINAYHACRKAAKRRRTSLREYIDGKTDESKGDAGEDGREEENGGV
ncbi:MAG: hypothetical protein IJ207_07275 [Treponema sp.]|uniref:hypothetical protein n=1 Tax=Treponema sp. TaxID=166 RepID=UPI0025CFF079|nr:hypothetical protein [Treponema sp.]MBQ9281986.1 hypothetical protein [Treponema sp.]